MISIAIPCYDMGGYGGKFLDYALSTISMQSYKDIEVVISDHSKDDNVLLVCIKWQQCLKIKYIRNEIARGSSSQNANNCIRNCRGQLIKILCQDDFLYDNLSIEKSVNAFTPDKNWLVSNYIHTNIDRTTVFNPHEPRLNDDLLFTNTIGTHSCLTIRNKDLIYFDEKLIWFMDCEYYTRLLKKFGLPIFLKDITMVQMQWIGQVTNTLADDTVRQKERMYLLERNVR